MRSKSPTDDAEGHRSSLTSNGKECSGYTTLDDKHKTQHAATETQTTTCSPKSSAGQTKRCFLLELFCGTAGVTAAFKQLGGEALGLDNVVKKGKLRGPVAKVDLCTRENQKMVLQMIRDGRVDALMVAPPCGTSSRAREIAIRDHTGRHVGPVPLRSAKHPNGLPSLRGLSALKVKLANKLYAFTREVLDVAIECGIPIVIENPKRSWMWKTSFFSSLDKACKFQQIHSCMYGGARLKRTAFLVNFEAPNLRLECDGSHFHLPWGQIPVENNKGKAFATSSETEYPWPLCKALALAFQLFLEQKGIALGNDTCDAELQQRMGAGIQPRGQKGPILLSEFKNKIEIKSSGVPVPKVITDNVEPPFQGIPQAAKLVSSRTIVEKGGSMANGDMKDKEVQISVFGVHRTPEEFFEMAKCVEHPLDSPQQVDVSNMRAILAHKNLEPLQIANFRNEQLRKYMRRAIDLANDERALRATLNPDVNKVLEGKRLLLFNEMAKEAGVNDPLLFQELQEGFRLTGDVRASGNYPEKLRPAMITVGQLRESSVWAKKMIFASCRKVGRDKEVAEAVYNDTMQQIEDGWVSGPFSASQLDEKFDHHWVPSKRFGVRQGSKIRAVDDFSEFLINASVTTNEKLTLYGIDEVVNTTRMFMGLGAINGCHESGEWEMDPLFFASGSKALGRKLQGRALDLKSAYKQLARHPSDSWASILAVWNPSKHEVEFFESVALPFGSVCAVMAFNRMARALRIILAELFWLVNTNFFDDFCQLEDVELTSSAWATAELVMKLLGWRISVSDDKRLPFADSFNMLGAVLDLGRSHLGMVSVYNKPSRVDDISSLVEKICSGDDSPQSAIETLKGRLLYAAGHTFGRCTHLAIQCISKAVRRGQFIVIDNNVREVLRCALRNLKKAKPREVHAWSGIPPILVFTDGASEEDGKKVTHGAVIYDPYSNFAQAFGDDVPSGWVEKWTVSGKRQVIGQAEIFPVLAAKLTWSRVLQGRAVLWFLDNSSAVGALVRSFSPISDNFELLRINAELDVMLRATNWYARVPSLSNLSDGPSRLEFKQVEKLGFQRCMPRYDFPHE